MRGRGDHSPCWLDLPWGGRGIWMPRLPQGRGYWTMLASEQPVNTPGVLRFMLEHGRACSACTEGWSYDERCSLAADLYDDNTVDFVCQTSTIPALAVQFAQSQAAYSMRYRDIDLRAIPDGKIVDLTTDDYSRWHAPFLLLADDPNDLITYTGAYQQSFWEEAPIGDETDFDGIGMYTIAIYHAAMNSMLDPGLVEQIEQDRRDVGAILSTSHLEDLEKVRAVLKRVKTRSVAWFGDVIHDQQERWYSMLEEVNDPCSRFSLELARRPGSA